MNGAMKWLSGWVLCLGAATLHAQVSVSVTPGNVQVHAGGVGVNTGADAASALGTDVEMQGVAVINNSVFIDGERVPQGTSQWKAKKTGKRYRIQWGKDGNIEVSEQGTLGRSAE